MSSHEEAREFAVQLAKQANSNLIDKSKERKVILLTIFAYH